MHTIEAVGQIDRFEDGEEDTYLGIVSMFEPGSLYESSGIWNELGSLDYDYRLLPEAGDWALATYHVRITLLTDPTGQQPDVGQTESKAELLVGKGGGLPGYSRLYHPDTRDYHGALHFDMEWPEEYPDAEYVLVDLEYDEDLLLKSSNWDRQRIEETRRRRREQNQERGESWFDGDDWQRKL